MGPTVGFVLLTILYASVGGVQGECRDVKNDDMIEYSCVGGHPSDLNNLPADTGKIRIQNMPMQRITPDTFSRFSSDLWVLACSHCGIEDIEPGSFAKLDNLQQLSLDNNRLTSVNEDWLEGLDYLTYLDLNYNDIDLIEDGVFESLPSLVDLRLSGNQIECLNLEDMSHLSSLRRIFLSENPELKCPNAISRFLEDRGVSFEKDPEWSRIPTDLVEAEDPLDHDTKTSVLLEKLHLLTSIAPPPMYYPTAVVPSWATSEEDDMSLTTHEHTYTPKPTTERSYYDRIRPVYEPPKTVVPPETMTYPPYVATSRNSEETDDRFRSEELETDIQTEEEDSLDENEDRHGEEPRYPSIITWPPFLATSPIYHQGGPSDTQNRFAESDTERTTDDPYKTYWLENGADIFATRYPLDDDYSMPVTNMPEEIATHVVRPPPSPIQEEFQPASTDDFFQTPYYEPTVTTRPRPSLDNYQERQEESTSAILSIETPTTDKPLPECPNSGPSQSIGRPFIHLFILPALLVFMRNVLVEGF